MIARAAVLLLLGSVVAAQTAEPEWIGRVRAIAQEGNAEAQYRLAAAYESGNGVSANPRLALVWYRRAAQSGHAPAQSALGAMYASGRGGDVDYVAAARWLDLVHASKCSVMMWQFAQACGSFVRYEYPRA